MRDSDHGSTVPASRVVLCDTDGMAVESCVSMIAQRDETRRRGWTVLSSLLQSESSLAVRSRNFWLLGLGESVRAGWLETDRERERETRIGGRRYGASWRIDGPWQALVEVPRIGSSDLSLLQLESRCR